MWGKYAKRSTKASTMWTTTWTVFMRKRRREETWDGLWGTMATRRLGHEAPRPPVKAESILLRLFFLLPLSRASAARLLSPSSPGPHHSLAKGPERETEPQHKGDGHCHSPQSPAILKATFQFRLSLLQPLPSLPPSATPPVLPTLHIIMPRPWGRTGTGHSGPAWDTFSRGRHHNQWCISSNSNSN